MIPDPLDPTADSPRMPMADAIRNLIRQAASRRTLRDIDEEERLHMAANLLAFVRGWLGAVVAGAPTADVAAALEQIGTVLAPPPEPAE